MRNRVVRGLTGLAAIWLLMLVAQGRYRDSLDSTRAAQNSASDVKNVPIYVTDFELASRPPRPGAKTGSESPKNIPTDAIYPDSEPAPIQARRMVEAFSNMLLEQFQKNGYNATRLTGSLPTSGVLLRGVFAEPDEMNRVRRAILGTGAPGPTFTLYVGVFNLGHQDQPLYLPAVVQAPSSLYGPAITLNAYIPMVKYDVPKDPGAEDVRKVCRHLVSQLTRLLGTNGNAVSQ